VGQDHVLDVLQQLVDLRGGAVLLTGPAGAGKSHLARTVLDRLTGEGAHAEVIQGGTATASVPLGACAHLVPVLTGEVPLAGLIAAALDRQRRRARHTPVVFLAEEVDRLDDASATLLAHLIDVDRIAVVATAREPKAIAAPLGPVLRTRRLRQIAIEPLGLEGVAELAAQAAGAALEPESGRLLHETTGGNPLWVNEIVRSAVARRRLVPTPRGFRLPEDASLGGLAQVLEARLLELDEPQRDALSLLAVGGNLPAITLESLVGPDVLVRLAAAGMVSATEYNGMHGVRLVHPMYRQALLQRLSGLETRVLLRRLIAARDSGPGPAGVSRQDRSMLVRLALWHAELGESFDPEALGWAAQAVQWGLLDVVRRYLSERPGFPGPTLGVGMAALAADGAVLGPAASPAPVRDARPYDEPGSSVLAAAAADSAEPAGGRRAPAPVQGGIDIGLGTAEDRWHAAFNLALAAWRAEPTFDSGLALAQTMLHTPEHAAQVVALVDEMSPLVVTDEQRALAGITQGIWLYWTSGQRDVSISELLALEKDLEPPWDRMVAATRAGLMLQGGQVGDAMAILDAIPPAPTAPPEAQAVYASPRAAGLMLAGQVERGVAMTEEVLPVAYGLGERWFTSMGELLISNHWGKHCLGRHGETRTSALGVAELLAGNDDENRALFLGMAARCLLAQGRPVSAVGELETAIRVHGSRAIFGFRPLIHTTHAVALAWTGRVEEAAAAALEGRRWNTPPRFFDTELDLADAIVLAAEGRRSRAAAVAEQAAEKAMADGNFYFAFNAHYLTARLRPSVVSQRELDAACERVDIPVAPLARRHVAALLEGDPSDLESAAQEAVDLGEQLLAVEILEAAVGRAKESGASAAQHRIEAALRTQRVRCEQARSPVVNLPTGTGGLTAREREIAGLAAQGWTSAAIAEELVLSVRTVESHLYRAFAKLGVRSRDELGPALHDGFPAAN
jgi:DNA-binding CsgD family transcriptional regulator